MFGRNIFEEHSKKSECNELLSRRKLNWNKAIATFPKTGKEKLVTKMILRELLSHQQKGLNQDIEPT